MLLRGLCNGFIMIIKDIPKQEILEIGNILPIKKDNIIPQKMGLDIFEFALPHRLTEFQLDALSTNATHE